MTSSTSAKTGVAPRWTTTLAEAIQVNAGTMTSSPGPTPIAASARWSAVVQEVVARACGTPWRAANASSNSATFGPWVSQPDSSGPRSASSSSSPSDGEAIGTLRALLSQAVDTAARRASTSAA